MSTYRTHPYQGAAKETSRLMLRLGNGCDELNVATGNRFMQEACENAISTVAKRQERTTDSALLCARR